jgi:hypothetical protein
LKTVFYLDTLQPLYAKWKRNDLEDGVREVDEGEKNEAGKRPHGRQNEDDGPNDVTDGPPDDI